MTALSRGRNSDFAEPQSQMFREAAEAPRVVARQIAENRAIVTAVAGKLAARSPRVVVTGARGSSDNAATYARYLIETRLGILTSSVGLSVSSIYAAHPKLEGALFLAISQSGRSPDLLATVQSARDGGAYVVALVNDASSPLAALAHDVMPLCAAAETSVAATKSYLASAAAIAHLVAQWSGDAELLRALADLPGRMEAAWQLDWSAALPVLREARDLYAVGRGLGFGASQEMALKFKEACGVHAEAFSAAEVLHGPMALVKPGFPVLMVSQNDETRPGMVELADRLSAAGSNMLIAGFAHERAVALPTVAANPVLEPILAVQSFYRLAEALARARGIDPDRPPHLNKITETI